jgi:hypothetical protein
MKRPLLNEREIIQLMMEQQHTRNADHVGSSYYTLYQNTQFESQLGHRLS